MGASPARSRPLRRRRSSCRRTSTRRRRRRELAGAGLPACMTKLDAVGVRARVRALSIDGAFARLPRKNPSLRPLAG